MLELDKVRSCSSSLLSAALPFTSCLLRPSSSLSESARGPAPTKFLRDEKNAPPRVRNLLHEPNLPSFRLPKCILVIECAGACECKCVEQKAVGAKEPIESDKLQHSSRAAVRALEQDDGGVRREREREKMIPAKIPDSDTLPDVRLFRIWCNRCSHPRTSKVPFDISAEESTRTRANKHVSAYTRRSCKSLPGISMYFVA